MPIYQFKSEGGEVIEEVVPVGTKDIIFDGEKILQMFGANRVCLYRQRYRNAVPD